MDKETETTINRLLADNKAAHDLSDYLINENKRLREALKEIADAHISGISGDVENIRYGLVKRYTILVDKARAALKEGE